MFTDEVVTAESEGIEYVGDFGTGELSLSIAVGAGGFLSTEGTTIGGAVTERPGSDCAVISEGTPSLATLTVESETTVDVGLGLVKP